MTHFTVNYFELFDIDPSYFPSLEKIKENYRKLQQQLHPDRFVGAAPQAKQLAVHYTAEINQAYQLLIDPVSRAIYLSTLRGVSYQEDHLPALPTEFLMDQMVLRERLENNDPVLRKEIEEKITTILRELEETLRGQEEIAQAIHQLQFYAKIKKELDTVELP